MLSKVDKETTVRRYSVAEIPWLVETVMKEVPQLPTYKNIKVDASRVGYLLQTHTKDESAFMVRLLFNKENQPVGGVAGYCTTQLLSWDKTTCDIFLWVSPEYRSVANLLKLVHAYKQWGTERRAKMIFATVTGGERTKELDAALRRFCKFEPVGTIYLARA